MNVRLCPNQPGSRLAMELGEVGGPFAVTEVDLTNCIRVKPKTVIDRITKCCLLQYLRCTACRLPPTALLRFVLWQLPHLVEVEFSFPVGGRYSDSDINRFFEVPPPQGGLAESLRRVYFEMSSERDFFFLSNLLRYCPNADNLRVHLVCGEFHRAVEECRALLASHEQVDSFTFTSEVPSPVQPGHVPPYDFAEYAAVCANVTYQRSSNSWSCFHLWDLARADVEPRTLPSQLAVVAVPGGMTVEWIRFVGIRQNWTCVRQLCLVLFPQEPSIYYPVAGGSYRDCLGVLSAGLSHLVELNVSSFHFALDLDVTALLQDGSLRFLQSLSAPPCGFRRVSALRCLALSCPDFKELDVRFERKGSFRRCLGCEDRTLFTSEEGTEFRDGASPAFRNGLATLTLSEVHDAACMWFIKCCKPTATVRMAYSPWNLECSSLCRALADNSAPGCLILRHHGLRLDDAALLTHLFRVADLQYLYLLSEAPLSHSAASDSVTVLRSLPQLKCLHVHYRDVADHSVLRTLTWMRRNKFTNFSRLPSSRPISQDVVQNGPCFLCCSTATFVGLAKPLGRNVQPML